MRGGEGGAGGGGGGEGVGAGLMTGGGVGGAWITCWVGREVMIVSETTRERRR